MSAIPPLAATLPSAPPSPARELWRDFRRNRGAVIGLAVLGLLVFCALFADVISPYDPSEQFRDATLHSRPLAPDPRHAAVARHRPGVGRPVALVRRPPRPGRRLLSRPLAGVRRHATD